MGHIHNYKTCRDGVCGETIVTCKQCRMDLHCFTFPADWLGCCTLNWSKCVHKDISLIFCSAHCRRDYMIAYDERLKMVAAYTDVYDQQIKARREAAEEAKK